MFPRGAPRPIKTSAREAFLRPPLFIFPRCCFLSELRIPFNFYKFLCVNPIRKIVNSSAEPHFLFSFLTDA
jgi:hypothetical protein